ncbi:ribokinase [Egicoccus sp. AB-alg2]|uniref:ribokinase n=1 Tax=Egicoccus sp. AB-alg2 TaxID=3242693 RepID=UPI00359DD68F
MARGRVAVVGSVNMDVVVPVPHLPAPGETVLGGHHRQLPGGKGANQAVGLARLDREVALIGCVGRDDFGQRLRRHLSGEGIDAAGLRETDAPTGIAVITVADDGENQIAVSPGANSLVGPEDVEAGGVADADVVLCQLEVPVGAVEAAATLAGGVFVLNPAPARALPPGLLQRVDVLVPNRTELGQLGDANADLDDLDDIADVARSLGLPAVAVTLGGQGVLCVTPTAVTHLTPPSIEVVDTTGAGDAFCAGLVDALIDGADLVSAAHFGMVVAGKAITRQGAQTALPRRDELACG